MIDQNDGTVVREDHADAPGAVTIRLNRPRVKNALGPAEQRALNAHLSDCQYDPAVKVVFITGTDDAFCSGADLNVTNANTGDVLAAGTDFGGEIMTRIITMPKIVIAAVNGASAGLGNHITLCADLCLARRDAAFHFTGPSKGIPSMQMGALLLPMTVGLKRAKAVMLRGGKVTAERAEDLGFVNWVVEPENWENECSSLATEFSQLHLSTIAHNKYQLNQGAMQMIGALKLSLLAGSRLLSNVSDLPTGRIKHKEMNDV